MVKIPQAVAAAAEEADSTSFDPLPPGPYDVELRECNVKEGPSGPYLQWVYEIPAGYDHAGRRFWNNTSFVPAAAFKLKEAFEAHGVPLDTDTDELIGTWVTLQVAIGTIQKGDKAGQPNNNVTKVMAYQGAVADAGDDEPPF